MVKLIGYSNASAGIQQWLADTAAEIADIPACDTGAQDLKGDKGDTGPQGEAGKTPVKGVDYFTDADKAELVEDVLKAAPPTCDGTVRS